MKVKVGECLKIVLYTIFGILLVISSYTIIINIHHYQSLTDVVIVSEADNDYSKYKDNINVIEEKLNTFQNKNGKEYTNLIKTLTIMKKGGVFRLIPKTKLKYQDLYQLNEYFMEELINNNWVTNIKKLEISEKYQDVVTMIINNSNYLNSVFTNNSLILSDSKQDNKIEDNYHFILSNYLMYSNIVLDMCNEIGG